MTTFSPQIVAGRGDADVERAAVDSIAIWPSCGRRRSTMFMSAMILMRLTSAGPIEPGRSSTSCSAPSMRKRTRTRSSCGSMWMSEARSRSAWVMISCTTWTTGASSVAPCRLGCASSRRGRVARLEGLDLRADAGQGPVAVADGPHRCPSAARPRARAPGGRSLRAASPRARRRRYGHRDHDLGRRRSASGMAVSRGPPPRRSSAVAAGVGRDVAQVDSVQRVLAGHARSGHARRCTPGSTSRCAEQLCGRPALRRPGRPSTWSRLDQAGVDEQLAEPLPPASDARSTARHRLGRWCRRRRVGLRPPRGARRAASCRRPAGIARPALDLLAGRGCARRRPRR